MCRGRDQVQPVAQAVDGRPRPSLRGIGRAARWPRATWDGKHTEHASQCAQDRQQRIAWPSEGTHLSEDLADLRTGDEISLRAKNRIGWVHVVAVRGMREAHLHVACERNGARGLCIHASNTAGLMHTRSAKHLDIIQDDLLYFRDGRLWRSRVAASRRIRRTPGPEA